MIKDIVVDQNSPATSIMNEHKSRINRIHQGAFKCSGYCAYIRGIFSIKEFNIADKIQRN